MRSFLLDRWVGAPRVIFARLMCITGMLSSWSSFRQRRRNREIVFDHTSPGGGGPHKPPWTPGSRGVYVIFPRALRQCTLNCCISSSKAPPFQPSDFVTGVENPDSISSQNGLFEIFSKTTTKITSLVHNMYCSLLCTDAWLR